MKDVTITATAPTRIDLAGGTLDIWPLYAFHPGFTCNVAIDLVARASLTPTQDRAFRVRSVDMGIEVEGEFGEWEKLGSLPLVREIVVFYSARLGRGFELEIQCESPAGAGLGGSSTLNIAICAAFDRAVGGLHQRTEAQRVDLAMNLEARVLGIPTGIQDYMAAIRGGANVIGVGRDGVCPIRVPRHRTLELMDRLVLIYSGTSRNSGINNWQVLRERVEGNPIVKAALGDIADASSDMAWALLKGPIEEMGPAMRREWEARSRLAPGILTPEIERATAAARRHAKAWKVCGAGGGGCVVFVCEPDKKAGLRAKLARAGFPPMNVKLSQRGLQVEVRSTAGARRGFKC